MNIKNKTLKLGTRKSALAMWQAKYLKSFLEEKIPDLEVELVKVTTTGDRFLSRPLDDQASKETGIEKGFFTKELEEKLLSREIDAAIHSLKDLPTILPPGLYLGAISQREEMADILITGKPLNEIKDARNNTLPDLLGLSRELNRKPQVGTASQRRVAQLGEVFPYSEDKFIRGNVDTRLRRLLAGEFDAILLAEAGLARLYGAALFQKGSRDEILWQLEGEKENTTIFLQRLNPGIFLPACSQGFLGVEIREDDARTREIVDKFNDKFSSLCAISERAFLRTLEAGCHAPVAGYARFQDIRLHLSGKVLAKDGSKVIAGDKESELTRDQVTEDYQKSRELAGALGNDLAHELLKRGATELLS